MGGFFGAVSNAPCVEEIYYGTDYHSHLGTRRGGIAVMATHDPMEMELCGSLLLLKDGVLSPCEPGSDPGTIAKML